MKKLFFRRILTLSLVLAMALSLGSAQAQGADSVAPSDVDNVQVVAGDAKVVLTWDQATDNVGVTGYKIYMGLKSVSDEEQDYDLPSVKTEKVTTYDVTGLQNGTTYYFAVTALDAAGNESDNYSFEASATPVASTNVGDTGNTGTEDTEAPTVSDARAVNNVEVRVIFSEAIVLPKTAPENAFTLEDQAQGKQLVIISASLDSEDLNGKTVLLSTEPQIEGNSYLLTASADIKDKANNPIVSGVSDTAIFKGKAEDSGDTTSTTNDNTASTDEDTTPPEIKEVQGLSKAQVQIDFSEEVILNEEDPTAGFLIYESADEGIQVQVANAKVDENDKKVLVITTATEMTGGTEYVIRATKVADTSGNLIKEGFESTGLFKAPESDLKDLIPPEDVTEFLAKLDEMVVKLSWTASINTAGDLIDQIVYQSEDKGKNYDKGKSLGPDVAKYDIKGLKAGKEYTFKITVKDASGNESKGVTTFIKLPETGPALISLLLLSSLGAGVLVSRKRK